MHLTCYSAEMANEAETGFAKALLAHRKRINQLLGLHADRQQYLTGNWAVQVDAVQGAMEAASSISKRAWAEASLGHDPSRYPHVCPRCSGPAYVGAVEVDCAGGCK